MTAAVAIANIVLGIAYCGYGVIAASELHREWRSFGFSHFGAAWIFMAFTCGPHHLVHGIHVGLEGRTGGGLDLLSVAVGFPVGVMWLLLRVEAFTGGRGDRFVLGRPAWLRVIPPVAAVYLVELTALSVGVLAGTQRTLEAAAVANVILVAVYMAIGWVVLRTQLRNHPFIGGWSVSGLCLTGIFPTCALMHGVWAVYSVAGVYASDAHGDVVDWLSIPAGLYFLWVVRQLYRRSLRDWNDGPDEVPSRTPVEVGGGTRD